MNMNTTRRGGFWRGFGGILSIAPERTPPVFTFRGRDILGVTPEEALKEDWVLLGKDFRSSISEDSQHEQSDPAPAEASITTR